MGVSEPAGTATEEVRMAIARRKWAKRNASDGPNHTHSSEASGWPYCDRGKQTCRVVAQ